MEVELIGKKNYTLIINDLLMPIDPKKSSAKVSKSLNSMLAIMC